MTIAWVLGGNGLLGSALHRTLRRTGTSVYTPVDRFSWGCESDLSLQLTAAVNAFATCVGREKNWQIYWAAGIGTMGSVEEELAVETRTLSSLLSIIQDEPRLLAAKGCFIFASSAGAIYAGATDDIITENTPIAPTTAYAGEKLKQENLIGTFASNNRNVNVLLARISTLYGPGQATGKQQGLIAMFARRILRNQPIQIYVPFDTIRDYITSDDAAALIFATLHEISGNQGTFIKIVASERPTTVAEIISSYKKITRRPPRIVTSLSNLSGLYARKIRFRSIVLPINRHIPRTNIMVGIAHVMAAEKAAFTQPKR